MNEISGKTIKQNPLLTEFDTLHQTVPFKKIHNEHYIPALKYAINAGRKEIESIALNEQPADFNNTIETLDKAAGLLDKITNILFNLNHAETSSQLQEITREASSLLTDFENDIIFNHKLFKRVQHVYDQRKELDITPEQQTLLKKTYLRFYKNGIILEKSKQERLRAISKEIAELSLRFDDNVLAETNNFFLNIVEEKELSGIPDSVKKSAAQEAQNKSMKGWMFTLHAPSYLPFMKYADNRKLREKMYRAMASRGFKNNKYNNAAIAIKIANLRLEKAKLLGYPTYAHFVLEDRMADNPETVNDFLNKLLRPAKLLAINEIEEVQNLAYDLGVNFKLQYWDWLYYSEKLKKKKFDFDEEELKPFFELNNVKNGVFELAKRLWGLTFKPNKVIDIYNPDVEIYEVFDKNDSFLSVLYLDFFPREGKNGGAWMTSFREQEVNNGINIRPHVSIVCNFSKPVKDNPSILTFDEFNTFLHEFGHAVHGMLSNVNYNSLSGTNVYRDFVELPSQLLENWATEKEYLDIFASHYKTGKPIPEELINKIIALRKFNSAYNTLRQVGFGINDMAWHSIEKPVKEDIQDFEAKAMKMVKLLPCVEGTLFSTAFSHIFAGGYAAGYYSYKWAEVLDAEVFAFFKKKGIFDTNTANLFRKHILSKGGAEHPMVLYKKFSGKEPSIEPMLERDGLKPSF